MNISELIYKYLRKELSPKEEIYLNNWIEENDKNKTLFNEIVSGNNFQKHMMIVKNFSLDRAYLLFQLNIKHRQFKRHSINRFTTISGVVALVTVFVTVFFFIKFNNQLEIQQSDLTIKNQLPYVTLKDGTQYNLDTLKSIHKVQYIVNNIELKTNKDQHAMHQLVVPPRQSQTICLSDGTKIVVSPDSKLIFPTEFNDSVRYVELHGEAYFQVQKSHTPFIVRTKDMLVQVYGTRFTVNDRQNSYAVLVDGSISIKDPNADNELLILPGEKGYIANNITLHKTKCNVTHYTSWVNGLLTFDKTPLKDVMVELERWYAITYSISDDIPNIHFSGVINLNSDIQSIIKALEINIHSICFKLDNEHIEITIRK